MGMGDAGQQGEVWLGPRGIVGSPPQKWTSPHILSGKRRHDDPRFCYHHVYTTWDT